MPYTVKEIFYTLQGEGFHTGRPAVFCRFASCNLWTGQERDRHRAICQFCDTDFVGTDGDGGGHFRSAGELAAAVARTWPVAGYDDRMVVCTGGEPLLQLDVELVDALHNERFYVAIETNGTRPAPDGIDWICVSPKIGAPLALTAGDELKLVYPQEGGDPAQFEHLDFRSFRLSPMDGPTVRENTAAAVEYCLKRPKWRLNLQTHKYLGIP
jgi:7-carboxy-7-deazaguanine synthase